MKKMLSLVLALVLICSMAPAMAESVSITLWTYPIGSWGKAEGVDEIVKAFNQKYPDIQLSVEYLDYSSGDDQVTAAIEAGTTPDIIMEGPERLVSNWGALGKMVDLSDLWTEEITADILAKSAAVEAACRAANGEYYEYPLCMTTHCMAINYELFEAAGALEFLDQETRTWTTEGFKSALEALVKSGVATTGVVYCGGQGGDQGTRALATNLFSAKFTNPEHTAYTMNEENGVKGIEYLVELANAGLLSSDAGAVASDELQLFSNGTIAMSFCWNASNAANYADSVNFTPFAMAFPSDDGVPELCGGIWGFGIFDNGDASRIEAAKTFISFVSDDPEQGPKSVFATGFFPVRASFGDIYTGTDKENYTEFLSFMPYLGDYYNVTGNWVLQRTEWWNMLQKVFDGEDVTETLNAYAQACNAGL